MKVTRKQKIKTDYLKVGDNFKVKITLPDGNVEKHKATAIKNESTYILCLLDDCLNDAKSMNETETAKGGWEQSELRAYLRGCKIKVKGADILPDEFGDDLSILTLEEVFGCDSDQNDVGGQIKWMKDARHRITIRKGEIECWWLRDVVFFVYFAYVDDSGDANNDYAPHSLGVRPCFRIAKKEKRRRRSSIIQLHDVPLIF